MMQIPRESKPRNLLTLMEAKEREELFLVKKREEEEKKTAEECLRSRGDGVAIDVYVNLSRNRYKKPNLITLFFFC